MIKFHNKDGSLTAYALACGYMEVTEIDQMRVTMYQEHSTYHVIFKDFDSGFRSWVSFARNELTKARHAYNRIAKALASA